MANLVKLRLRLNHDSEGYPPGRCESLWVEAIGKNKYRLRNLPFFFRAATFDDEVIVRDVGDDLVEVVRISRSSGNSLVRVVHDTLEKRQDLLSFLEEAGFLFEGLSQHSLIAINIEDKAGYQRLNTWLEEFVADGLADYEEPLLRF